MPQFAFNCSSLWNMHEQDSSESLSKHPTSKFGSPPQNCLGGKHLGSGLQDQDSSSSQSTIQSQQDGVSVRKSNSLDQCASSKMVQGESYHKHIEGQLEPAFFIGYSDFWTNSSQHEMSQSSIHIPNFNGLFTAYGPHPIVQQKILGIAPGRVPLPADLAEDGPIYVNAKQYHGILRRRQVRAKLEAQNKLVKTRKPYLHESRHVHALNRIRGSGGRFLSTKNIQQPEPTPSTRSYAHEQQQEAAKHDAPPTVTFYGITQNTNGELNFKQPDQRFSGMSSHMAVSLSGRGEQRGASVVR